MNTQRENKVPHFDWVPFYEELAKKLLPYQKNRKPLVQKIRQIFESTGIPMPTLERDNQLTDMDPFTVFALFNKTSMKESNRKKIMSAIGKLFGVSTPCPMSDPIVPCLNNQNATFYAFRDERGKRDMDDLWDLFAAALEYADSPTPSRRAALIPCFDRVIQKKYNGNSKVTMGLFWISPDTFMNLDSRSVWYIYESGKIPASVVETLPEPKSKISAQRYFEISDRLAAAIQSGILPLSGFCELSYEAWRYSKQVDAGEADPDPKPEDPDPESVRYWLYAPGAGASIWEACLEQGIMAIGWEEIGDLRQYDSKTAMVEAMKAAYGPEKSYTMDAYATWQFSRKINTGDVIFAKKGRKLVIGHGIVTSDYIFDASQQENPNIRYVRWIHSGEWPLPFIAPVKTLTDITPYTEDVENLKAIFEDLEGDGNGGGAVGIDVDMDPPPPPLEPYGPDDFLRDVYMDTTQYMDLTARLQKKRNVILQGPPGVGKTYAARRLAYSMIGTRDPDRVQLIQFHQSYSYEDFIMGFRPTETGFALKHGAFYSFCKMAEIDSDNKYFFIIDEINRGNLSKIFGELFMLLESDKRGRFVRLLYSNEKFSVPKNVYVIGTMNTADRSLALLDYALRRRFAFFDMFPAFASEGFRAYREGLDSLRFNCLIQRVEELNEVISADDSLGEGFQIGHSFFCNLKAEDVETELRGIVDFELVPLLKEYWFDDPEKAREWIRRLRDAVSE